MYTLYSTVLLFTLACKKKIVSTYHYSIGPVPFLRPATRPGPTPASPASSRPVGGRRLCGSRYSFRARRRPARHGRRRRFQDDKVRRAVPAGHNERDRRQ